MSAAAEYQALRTGLGAHRLPRDVIGCTGPDAAHYLQGQCSQDLAPLEIGESTETLVLAPDGRLEALARVVRFEAETFLLDVDGGHGAALLERLARFKLRSRLTLEPLEWVCIALRGAALDAVATPEAPVVAAVDWNGWAGLDLLGPPDAVTLPEGAVPCGEAAWEAARIESGVPVMGRELTGGVIPAETGTVARTVSFTKGCYTGQELVARIDSRGAAPPNRLVGVVFVEDAAAVEPGAALFVEGRDRAAGRLTSIAWCFGLGALAGLAYVHRSVEVPGPLFVADPSGTAPQAAEARSLPLL